MSTTIPYFVMIIALCCHFYDIVLFHFIKVLPHDKKERTLTTAACVLEEVKVLSYIYIYIYVGVCVCIYIYFYLFFFKFIY